MLAINLGTISFDQKDAPLQRHPIYMTTPVARESTYVRPRRMAEGGQVEPEPIPSNAIPSTRSPMAPTDWVKDWYAKRKFGDDRDYLMNAYRNQILPTIDNIGIDFSPNITSGRNIIDGMYDPLNKSVHINSAIDNENGAVVHELGHAADYATNYNPKGEFDTAVDILTESYDDDKFLGRARQPYDNSIALDDFNAIERGEHINRLNIDPWERNITKSAKKYAEQADLKWDYSPYHAAVDRIKKSIGFKPGMTEAEFSKAGGDDLLESVDLNLIMDQSQHRPSYMMNNNPIYNMLANSQYVAPAAELYDKFGDKSDFRYLTSPTEVSSRLMEMRYDMGVKPDEKVTKERLEEFTKNNKG